MNVLVINCGSSSLKYQLINSDTEAVLAKGLCERIGIDGRLVYQKTGLDKEITEAAMPTHKQAIQMVLDALVNEKTGAIRSLSEIDAVGHRVVHGGERANRPVLVNDEVKSIITDCIAFAPLHNPANLAGITACEEIFPGVPNVAVFDTESSIPPERFAYALNQRLPEDIVVVKSDEVPLDWHPRYQDNISKTYEYHIYNAQMPNPLKTRYCTFVSFPLDIGAMREGAKYLIGAHDFVSFCNIRTNTQDTVRTVYDLTIEKKDDEIVLRITGNGFLYNMVRIIAGVLIRVGRGFYTPEKVKEILEAKVHTSEGATALPNGLVLVKIDYK